MTGDRRTTEYDDATIEQLVRDVAGEWTMPPVRLDAPGWRDRVRGARARRIATAGGWFGRFGQAATAAIVLTVAAALVAVVLTRPATEPGKSPPPTSGSHTSNPAPEATTLPKLLVTGREPSPTIVFLRDEIGDFVRVDLSIGSVGGPLTGKGAASELQARKDGSMVCLCVAESGSVGGMSTDNTVSLDRYDARGKLLSSTPIEHFGGEPDPRDQSDFVPERPAHVITHNAFSADGRYGFVGWSYRAHPVWHRGVIVVDLTDGSIAARVALPDMTDGEGDYRRVVDAPRILGDVGGGRIALALNWYEWTPPVSENARYSFGNEVDTAVFGGGALEAPKLVPTATDCSSTVTHAGPLPGGGMWLSCTTGGPQLTIVRRLAADDTLLGDIRITGLGGVETDPTAVSPDGTTLFVWDPITTVLTRVDLATGQTTTGKGQTAAGDPGPLARIGSWLAPTAAAKSSLLGAIVVSPDGARVYAIGVKDASSPSDSGGSTGVYVFDAGTAEPVATWDPTADYVSIAVSADGGLVYAAGLPEMSADGRTMRTQQASITVYDAATGSVRLIAGELGKDALSFLSPALH